MGCSARRATSGAMGTTSSTETAMGTTAGNDLPTIIHASRQMAPGKTPHPSTAAGMRWYSCLRTAEVTSAITASAASVPTSPTVAGKRLVSNAASVKAANAAMSPKGTKMTRVTEKTSTRPKPARR